MTAPLTDADRAVIEQILLNVTIRDSVSEIIYAAGLAEGERRERELSAKKDIAWVAEHAKLLALWRAAHARRMAYDGTDTRDDDALSKGNDAYDKAEIALEDALDALGEPPCNPSGG